jgi:hypothetical protein
MFSELRYGKVVCSNVETNTMMVVGEVRLLAIVLLMRWSGVRISGVEFGMVM